MTAECPTCEGWCITSEGDPCEDCGGSGAVEVDEDGFRKWNCERTHDEPDIDEAAEWEDLHGGDNPVEPMEDWE